MNVLLSLVAVIVLLGLAMFGVEVVGLHFLFGVILPYFAIVVFLGGVVYRVMDWAKSPVPFRIPTTCGQQKSLSWIKHSRLDNPYETGGVLGRMLLDESRRTLRLYQSSRRMDHPPGSIAD